MKCSGSITEGREGGRKPHADKEILSGVKRKSELGQVQKNSPKKTQNSGEGGKKGTNDEGS